MSAGNQGKWSNIVMQMKEKNDNEMKDDDDDDEATDSQEEENGNILTKDDLSTHVDSSKMMTESVGMQWLDKICGITPTTKRGQNIYMACMLVIPLIPISALITQNVILLNDVIIRKTDLLASDASVEHSDEAARLVSSIQQERSEALFSLFLANNIETQVANGLDLQKRFLQTDFALENISNWRSPEGEEMFRSKLRFQIRLDDFRKAIIRNNETSETDESELVVEDAMAFYTYATKVLLDDISNIIRASNGSRTWRYLVTYKNILRAIESVGIELSFGIRFLGSGKLIDKNIAKFIENHKLAQEYLLQGETFLTEMRAKLRQLKASKDYKAYNSKYRELIRTRNATFVNETEKIASILKYFRSSRRLMNDLRQIIFEIRFSMKDIIVSEISSVDRKYAFGLFVLAILFLISPLIVVLIRNAVRALHVFSSSVESKVGELRREWKRSEILIYQMLPKNRC